ncbi:hypothetical protein [Streptomyces sp. SID5910]|uniref:hypothetical protein n=1 Tax=Streptomyces sp. SID5910 TaxID=2690312 RepID=UPI0013706767|nr:hypothetical protein [Streptomyces sp. SID5910]MYR45073.1 hypothetical protein [Streptomyces sp. SID5910]
MKRRTIVATATAVSVLGLITGLFVWLSQPSYDDIVKDCATALDKRADGSNTVPNACEDVKEEDYDTLRMAEIIDDLGWVDDEGNVDKNKMLEDALNGTP